MSTINSFLQLDSSQYAQVPIGATRVATKGTATLQGNLPAWSPAADFRVKCKFITTGAPSGTVYTILAGTGGGATKFFLYQGNGIHDRLTLRIEQSAVQYYVQSATTLLQGAVNEIKIERISGVTTMTLNGSLVNVPYTMDAFDVARVYYRDGYGPFLGGYIWDLELTDLTTPANSRFYPLDNTYGRTYSGRDLESTQTLVDHFNDTDFLYWQLVSGTATIDGVSIQSSAGRFLVGSTIVAQSGANLRINFETGVIKIDHHFVMKLEVLAGDCNSFYADICDSVGGTATLSNNVITIQGIRTSDKTNNSTYKFVDFNPSGGTSITFKVLSITQTPVLQWYNRTSGDVVTVYPDAIKPTETFWVACKFRINSEAGEANPRYFTIGTGSGSNDAYFFRVLPGTGTARLFYYNGASATLTSLPVAGLNILDGEDHIVIFNATSSGGTLYFDDLANTATGTHTARTRTIDSITINGLIDPVDQRVYYFYLYSALSAGDITALMQGENPESVGTVRQGYDLNGNGNEKSGGNPLVLYGNPSFTVSGSPRKSKHSTVESIVCGIAYGI